MNYTKMASGHILGKLIEKNLIVRQSFLFPRFPFIILYRLYNAIQWYYNCLCLTLMIVKLIRDLSGIIHRKRHPQAPNPCLDSSGDRALLS